MCKLCGYIKGITMTIQYLSCGKGDRSQLVLLSLIFWEKGKDSN